MYFIFISILLFESLALSRTSRQAGIQIGRAELLDDTMVKVLNKANHTKHREATTLLFELSVRAEVHTANA